MRPRGPAGCTNSIFADLIHVITVRKLTPHESAACFGLMYFESVLSRAIESIVMQVTLNAKNLRVYDYPDGTH